MMVRQSRNPMNYRLTQLTLGRSCGRNRGRNRGRVGRGRGRQKRANAHKSQDQ